MTRDEAVEMLVLLDEFVEDEHELHILKRVADRYLALQDEKRPVTAKTGMFVQTPKYREKGKRWKLVCENPLVEGETLVANSGGHVASEPTDELRSVAGRPIAW